MMVIVPLLPTLQTLDTYRINSAHLVITPMGIIKGYDGFRLYTAFSSFHSEVCNIF